MPRSRLSTSLQAPAPKAPAAAAAAAAPTALPALPHPGEPPAQSPLPVGLSDGRPSPLSLTLASGTSSSLLSAGCELGRSRTDLPHLKEPAFVVGQRQDDDDDDETFPCQRAFSSSSVCPAFFFVLPFLPPFCFSFSSSSSSSQGLLCSCWGGGTWREGGLGGHAWRFSIRDRL